MLSRLVNQLSPFSTVIVSQTSAMLNSSPRYLNILQFGFGIESFLNIMLCHQAIEKVKTDKNDKPYTDVKILNVTVPKL